MSSIIPRSVPLGNVSLKASAKSSHAATDRPAQDLIPPTPPLLR